MHYSNPIVLKIPCSKFHASSFCQRNVKVGGPKRRFKKPTWNRVKNVIIDDANLERLNVFHVQTLLRQYEPCEHNNIDNVRYSSQGLIKTVQKN